MMRIEQAAKRVPDVLFADPSDPTFGLMPYVAQVNRHFVEHGLNGLFYFTSPESKWINIVLSHPQVARDVEKQYVALELAYVNTSSHLTLI